VQSVIELSGLSVRFGKRQILDNRSISLSSRTIGLLGTNGAGKSTLIQTLLGFCPVAGGHVSGDAQSHRASRWDDRSGLLTG
jgi:ABC-type Mn2+/Zn2+ transport system ATPase subunit